MPVQRSDNPGAPVAPLPMTTGGNSTLSNGDEGASPALAVERMAVEHALAGYDDSFNYQQGAFRKQGL